MNLADFSNGWIIGDFSPSVLRTDKLEVCIKSFKKGDREEPHFQKIAHEFTLVISGTCRMAAEVLAQGEGLVITPRTVADFEALTDCVILGVKWPSAPSDKVAGDSNDPIQEQA